MFSCYILNPIEAGVAKFAKNKMHVNSGKTRRKTERTHLPLVRPMVIFRDLKCVLFS